MADDAMIDVARQGDVTVIAVTSRCRLIEDINLEQLDNELNPAALSATPPWIVLDMSQTQFFGSGFIEVLLRIWRELQAKGDCRLVLCGVQEYCHEVLTITHLDQLWPVVSSRAEAINQFSSLKT